MTRVAAIGECMIELRHADAETLKLGFGGDTLNTAVYLARLGREAGLRVDYVTALGDDAYSDDMIGAWQEEGVGTDLVARLFLTKISSSVTGSEQEAISNTQATSGNQFRYTAGQYVFNLATSTLSKGTWSLRIDTGDGVPRSVLISLK